MFKGKIIRVLFVLALLCLVGCGEENNAAPAYATIDTDSAVNSMGNLVGLTLAASSPVSGARVFIVEQPALETTTNSDGRFLFHALYVIP